VDALVAEPPCPTPRLGDETSWWTRCVQGQVVEARRRVAAEMAAMAEQARKAELEERRVRALERSAQAAEDQARAQEGIATALNRPPACTTIRIARGAVRTVCDSGFAVRSPRPPHGTIPRR
jgi:hypothetical protein